ncbi:helix-turn-helix domain-containing protein [Acrocarpospora sp. B8E8]|uniref:helix-turn-helix domain-containing protein n=1 Tax=Acrocarpospora sp. B8E8 TaxID=3153572 RepID=UPI00325F8622
MAGRPAMCVRDKSDLVKAMSRAGHDTVTLAERVGKTKQFIAYLCNGRKTSCRRETAAAIAEVLGVPTDALFFAPSPSDDSDTTIGGDMPVSVASKRPPKKSPKAAPEEQFLFLEEVVELTRIPESTLRYMRHKGEGPPLFLAGGRLRARRSAVLDWFAQLERSATS